MYKKLNSQTPYFYGVALSIILLGAVIFTAGLVEWIFYTLGSTYLSDPSGRVIGGLIITALGYIHLELESIRLQLGKR